MVVNKSRTRKFVFSLAFIFIMPALSAWYLFYYSDHSALKSSNYGELIRSPFDLSELELKEYSGAKMLNKSHKWVILYWTPKCEDKCKNVIDKLLRVRMVLGKEMLRTQAWLATDEKINGLMFDKLTAAGGFDTKAMLLPSSVSAQKRLGEKNILLVDPSGNVMMRYAEDVLPKAINSDLKQLLKLSRMG